MPETRYARNGDVSLAYAVSGDGPIDLLVVQGYISHLELSIQRPPFARFIERLESFARVIRFDKRGVGLSDQVDELPSLEQRMEDVRVILDAVGSERTAFLGLSEGGMMAMLFAATYPERTSHLVLCGAMARASEDVDYTWAAPREALVEASQLLSAHWGEGMSLEMFAPSAADDENARRMAGQYERNAASPRAAQALFDMFLDMDVRHVLPSITVPTLVVHRRGDRVVNRRAAEWMAGRIAGARYVELPGIDHNPWVGDQEAVLGEIEEFITGVRGGGEPDRVLATVMFTDIVGSTERATELGDTAWHAMLDAHNKIVREALARFSGREVKTTGDGFLATFDGPARAIRCGQAIAAGCAELGCPVRVGLHTGECEVMGDDVAGIAVHIAARVGALAEANEVLVSRTVKDLVAGSGLSFDARGTHTLKGIPDEWQLYAVAP